LKLKSREQFETLLGARKYQRTHEFQQRYAIRCGIEATISQGVRAFGMRRTHYIGTLKTHLQQTATAVAINLRRFVAFIADATAPRTPRRPSAFCDLRSVFA
jgi:transposase